MATPTQTIRLATPPVPSSSRPPRPPRPPRPQPPPYIPPFRARRLAAVSSPHNAQQLHWTRLKKSIHGIVNRLNASNLPHCVIDLFRLNLVRARGLFCKAVLRAQVASPNLSPIFACFVAVVGSRFPAIVNLLLRRLVAQLKTAYRNQDRASCFATARFIANLYNQHVIKDLLVLEFLCLCTVDPSDSSAELAVVTLRECAPTLFQNSPDALEFVFRNLREMLHDGHLGRRAQVAIENLLILRRNKFRDLPSTDPRLDLLHDKDIFTHGITLEEDLGDLEYECDNFQFDRKYEENEKAYLEIKKDILGAAMDHMPQGLPEDPGRSQSDKLSNPTSQAPESNTNNKDPGQIKTTDLTNTDLLNFRRTVYLTHNATLSAEESAHRLFLLMRENKGREAELCRMIIECCSQESSFKKVYGHLAHRICECERSYRAHFEELFADHYATIHRFDTRKIRIIAYLFAFLLAGEAISWNILEVVRIVEEETTASSRTFLKYLFQQIRENMGKTRTKERFLQADKDGNLKGVFPTDCAKNARFAINMFTTIGLGFLTDDLRDKLKDIPDQAAEARHDERDSETSTSSSSLSSSSSALSPSIGDEHPRGDLSDDNASRGLKRQQDEVSRTDSERPAKVRRLERSVSRRGDHESRRRREIRQNIELDDIERNHRAYVNSSSGSRSRRYAPEQSDEDERDYHSKRRRGQYSSRHGEGRHRDRHRSSRSMPQEYREGYRSDDEALRRPAPRDRHGRHRSDLEEYERSRRDDHRDVSPGYDGEDNDVGHHRDRRRSSKYYRAESPDSRERRRRHRAPSDRRHRQHYSDSESHSYSPDRRRRRSGSWRRRRSPRRRDSSEYSDAPSISRSPRRRRRH